MPEELSKKRVDGGVDPLGKLAGGMARTANTRARARAKAAKVTGAGVAAIRARAKRAHQALGGEYGDSFKGNLLGEDGTYEMPKPLVDDRERVELGTLTRRYEELTSPGPLAKAGKQLNDKVPARVKALTGKVGEVAKGSLSGLTRQELMVNALKVAAEGFADLERQAARASVSREYVIRRINEGTQGQKVSSLSEICLLRAYDVAAVTAGFWGLPANLALSMLIYFRAVQSVAMFYGYDVKDGPSGELDIASEVFQGALAPKTRTDVISEYIGKTLVYAESAAVKQATKRGWAAMVEQGGAALTIARIRALANGPARKAVERGGQKALEAGVFKKALAQVGQKMSLKTVGKMVPVIGAGFGAFFDTAQMGRVLDFADIFYHVRFINEKEERAQRLIEQSPFAKETQNKSARPVEKPSCP